MFIFIVRIVFFISLFAITPVNADDSTATMALGSVLFTRGTPLRMEKEDLYISPDKVRVRFEFANDTEKDIDTLVAFPLPDIDTFRFWDSVIGSVARDSVNFIDFRVKINGKPVPFETEQRATIEGKDVTALLVSAGAVINPVPGDGYKMLNTLSSDRLQYLEKNGLGMNDATDGFAPRWIVHTKFYWHARFPAHSTTVIEHEYAPITGTTFADFSQYESMEPSLHDLALEEEFCIGPASFRLLKNISIARNKIYKDTGADLDQHITDYILSTARNWNGPIGQFHLVLDKVEKDNVLSVCWDGDLKQTGPTTFEFIANDFTPRRDIHMVVFESSHGGFRGGRPR